MARDSSGEKLSWSFRVTGRGPRSTRGEEPEKVRTLRVYARKRNAFRSRHFPIEISQTPSVAIKTIALDTREQN